MSKEHRFGSRRWNRLLGEIEDWAQDTMYGLVEELQADGPPPGTVAITDPVQEYTRLLALRNFNSPLFWGNPAAQQRLAELEAQYGPEPAVPERPFP